MQIETNLTRDQWLDRRVVGIGSSDAAVIVGVSPYKSALQLYHEKLGTKQPHRGELEQLRWGNILERPIGQRYAEETGRMVDHLSPAGTFSIMRNDARPWQHASLDGLVVRGLVPHVDGRVFKEFPADGDGVLEIKNASSYVGERWKDEPPIEFVVQVQHQLAVTGKQWGSIAALIGGVLFLWQDLARDDCFIEILCKMELEFIQRIEAKDPPPVDGSGHTKEFLKFLYPRDTGTSVSLGPEFLDVESDLVRAKAEIKSWEGAKALAENRLKAAIGDATMARLPNNSSFTLKHQSVKAHMREASEFRVLRHQAAKLPGPRPELALPERVEA